MKSQRSGKVYEEFIIGASFTVTMLNSNMVMIYRLESTPDQSLCYQVYSFLTNQLADETIIDVLTPTFNSHINCEYKNSFDGEFSCLIDSGSAYINVVNLTMTSLDIETKIKVLSNTKYNRYLDFQPENSIVSQEFIIIQGYSSKLDERALLIYKRESSPKGYISWGIPCIETSTCESKIEFLLINSSSMIVLGQNGDEIVTLYKILPQIDVSFNNHFNTQEELGNISLVLTYTERSDTVCYSLMDLLGIKIAPEQVGYSVKLRWSFFWLLSTIIILFILTSIYDIWESNYGEDIMDIERLNLLKQRLILKHKEHVATQSSCYTSTSPHGITFSAFPSNLDTGVEHNFSETVRTSEKDTHIEIDLVRFDRLHTEFPDVATNKRAAQKKR